MGHNNFEKLKINSTVFAVSTRYVDGKLGGRIKVCRVKTFQNIAGEIYPVLAEKGNSKFEIDVNNNYLYCDLKDAINAIRTKSKKK